jgi:hypothetical protein
MQHFPIEDWADFVRGVASDEQKARLQDHLDRGCDHCIKTVTRWSSFAENARQELSYEPPVRSLHIARSYFFGYQSVLNQASGFRLAVLAFDSFQLGFVGGIRSGADAPRQLMYTCDDLVVDLQVVSRATYGLALTGQVMSSGENVVDTEGLALSVLRDDETLQKATSNEFGEFQISLPLEENLQLLITMEGAMVVLQLPN